jgi:hypothetical protein
LQEEVLQRGHQQHEHRIPLEPTFWLYPSVDEALQQVLAKRPQIIGFGEVHQRIGHARVQPAIQRFTEQLFGRLAPLASDLIVETWITQGNCGKHEAKVVEQVERTTERPASTENHVVTLLRQAKQAGVQPHILTVGCAEYGALLGGDEVDFEKLLALVTDHLRAKVEEVIARRQDHARQVPGAALAKADRAASARAAKRDLLVVYGGALHNDLFPPEGLERYSYALLLDAPLRERYLELDLYVPEYIEADEALKNERWYPVFVRHASARQVVLIERGLRSYLLILRRGGISSTPEK